MELRQRIGYCLEVGIALGYLRVFVEQPLELVQPLLSMVPAQADKSPALDSAAQLYNRHHHLPVELAAVIAQYGVQRLQISGLGEVRHYRAAPWRNLEEAHAGQVLQADVYNGLAYLHLLGQFTLAGQAVAYLP